MATSATYDVPGRRSQAVFREGHMSTDITAFWVLRYERPWSGPSSKWMVKWNPGDSTELLIHESPRAFSLNEAMAWATAYLSEGHGVVVASWTSVPFPWQYFSPEEFEWLGPDYWRAVLG